MRDRDLWDSYISSMEELNEEPPPEVKEAVFRRMRRYQRRRRWMRRMIPVLGVLLLLSGGGLFFEPFAASDEEGGKGLRILQNGSLADLKEFSSSENGKKNAPEKGGGEKDQDGGERKVEGSDRDPERGNDRIEASISDESASANIEEKHLAKNGSPSRTDGDGVESGPSSEQQGKGMERMERLTSNGIDVEDEKPGKPLRIQSDGFEEEKNASSFVQSIFVGGDLALNFTRLMDQRTIESFEASSLVATQGHSYFDKGITVGLSFSDRTRLVGRFFMNKKIGQRYQRYLEGRFIEQRIRLEYRSYGLLVEQDLLHASVLNEQQAFLSFYGGMDYSTLRSAERKEGGEDFSVEGNFRKHKLGLNVGLRGGIRTNAGLDVGLMLGSSGSLNDLSSGGDTRSVNKGASRSLSGSVGLSLRYHFLDR